MAGNEGGGRLSSSSSSELSCSLSVKEGTAGALSSDFGIAFGVDSSDGLLSTPSTASWFEGDLSSMRSSLAGVGPSLLPFCDLSGIVLVPGRLRRVIKASHVEGGRW